jgi:methyl-accepting chemotaxis protein
LQLPGSEGYGFLIDDDGRTIAHPDLQMAGLSLEDSTENLLGSAVNEMLSADTGVIEVNETDDIQTVAFAKIANTDWHVGIAVPQHAVTAPATEMQRNGLMISVIVATLACVAALYLSHRIVHPLRQLVFGVKHFAEGDLTYQMDIQVGNEVGELAKAFNTMAGKLYQRERRLKQTIDEMRIEIDVGNKVKEVKRITETDYFRHLQTSARELKAMLKE